MTKQKWNICLMSWVIEDGNYSDFQRGQIREFAIQFRTIELEKADIQKVSARHVGGAEYDVEARIVQRVQRGLPEPSIYIIDFGVLAYCWGSSHELLDISQYVKGRIEISIDAHHYVESLIHESSMPPMLYAWQIDTITKHLDKKDIEVERTGVLTREAPLSGLYTLSCTLLDGIAKKDPHDVHITSNPIAISHNPLI